MLSENGDLLLTPFSRACAALWVEERGRRFASYSVRKDKGVARGSCASGTLNAVKRLQHAAADACVAIDTDRTVVGFSRHTMLRAAARQSPKATKKILTYRAATADRLLEKCTGRRGLWKGFSEKKPPSLRTRNGNAPAASRGTTTTRRGVGMPRGEGRVIAIGDAADGGEVVYKKINVQKAEKAGCVVVGSRYDLEKAAVSSELLRAWLAIVAFGLSAEAKRDDVKKMRMQFGRALDYPLTFAFSSSFAEKHHGLAKALRSVAACPGKWKEAAAHGTAEFVIDGLVSFRDLLLKVRRISAEAAATIWTSRHDFDDKEVQAKSRRLVRGRSSHGTTAAASPHGSTTAASSRGSPKSAGISTAASTAAPSRGSRDGASQSGGATPVATFV